MAILVGGHPELSTCEGYFSSGKQPSQVDNSGCPPPKKAIIVYCYNYWNYWIRHKRYTIVTIIRMIE